ncbi:MAG: elongation factor P-like protein YeiP [Oceanospirillaceae bacterium]|nr:elongation factor P-like protein YeiP [Oceanospirillaceae bacterium]
MPKASELKRGHVVELNDHVYVVQNVDVRNPTSRGATTLYKIRFSQLPEGGKHEVTFAGDDIVKSVALERRRVSYLYREDELLTFMDLEDYNQYSLNVDTIEDQAPFLSDGLEGIMALLIDGQIVTVELPSSVILEVTECVPGMQSASATGRTKPAILSNGLEIQVPEYIKQGEKVKVNTETGKFMARA